MSGIVIIDDTRCPSVTAILRHVVPDEPAASAAHPSWAAAMGSLIHHRILGSLAIERLPAPVITGPLPEKAAAICDRAYGAWASLGLCIGHPRAIEVIHANPGMGFAGAPDLVAPIGGQLTLVEIKVAAVVRRSHRLQVGAYHALLDPKPARALIATVDPYAPEPCGTVEEIGLADLSLLAREFVGLTRQYHREHEPVWDPATGWSA